MAKASLSNFKLPPPVKTRLVVCSRVLDKSMTNVLSLLIDKGYRDVVACYPEKVQTILAELEAKPDGDLR